MAITAETYLNTAPEKFRGGLNQIRNVILENLPPGYVEEMSYGMLGYVVPLSLYPPGYLKKGTLPLPLMNLGYQKNHIALYHYGIYADKTLYDWFMQAYAAYAFPHKINMGKSCIRFQYMAEIPYELLADLTQKLPVDAWIEIYDRVTQGK
jgi:uncharacterized protein YdhG (YjbR/CyaY superfamily)